MSEPLVRPDFVTDEHLEYLDRLRESGKTNMFGAGPYLVRKFRMTEKRSHEVLSYWMKSFSKRRAQS